MNKTGLDPLNDFLFMKYMGEEGNEEQLQSFLNAVLHRTGHDEIVSLKILNTQLSADIPGDWACSIVDIRAERRSGAKANIEVQLRWKSNMGERSLSYWIRACGKSMQKGDDSIAPPQVITINLIEAEQLPINEVHASFHLWEDNHKDCMLTDLPEIHFIDMVKFRSLKEKDIEHNMLHRWLAFFDENTSDETIQKLIEMDASIRKAHEKIMSFAQNSDMLRLYEMQEKGLMDYNSAINKAIREGFAIGEQRGMAIARGRQKGVSREQVNYVLKLSQKNCPVAEIAELTDLPEEEVNYILNNN
jgi:predicted transposase/invertase (TIGR01784 family)